MRKNVFAAALILALGVGSFAACSSDDVVTPPQPGTETLGGTTFMTVKFAIPQGNAQRSENYNFVGLWSGRDKIESYKAYIFNGTAPTDKLEAVQVLTSTDFGTSVSSSNELVVKPTKAIRVQPGNKTVYVVVNPNTATDALLPAALATTTLQDFKNAYESKNLATAGAGVYTSSVTPANVKTSTENVAKIDLTTPTSPKDIIVMTGEPAGTGGSFTVADGVTEAQAVDPSSPLNQAAVKVKRTVARVVVTSRAASYQFNGDDPYTSGVVETGYNIGKISNLHFVTAQNERELYFQQAQASVNTSVKSATIAKWNSPAILQNATDAYGNQGTSEAADILRQYDYTNLWKNRANANMLGGNTVHQAAPAGTNWTTQEIAERAEDCDFILPTTHEYVAPSASAVYKYRKGNTAYVLVRGAFVPNEIQVGEDYQATHPNIAAAMTAGDITQYVAALRAAVPTAVIKNDGTVATPVAKVAFTTLTNHEPAELVYGVGTHKFYSSEYASQDPVFGGVAGQPIQKFKKVEDDHGNFLGYKMLYFAWVNPDEFPDWYNSPVYRNNIYHVDIDGISGLGENWNPLVPATPSKPSNDKDHPNNPDPFIPNNQVTPPTPPTTPGVPVVPTPITPPTPPTPPIKPSDPLTQKKTHMSVKVTVLPWQVHSYKFTLKN